MKLTAKKILTLCALVLLIFVNTGCPLLDKLMNKFFPKNVETVVEPEPEEEIIEEIIPEPVVEETVPEEPEIIEPEIPELVIENLEEAQPPVEIVEAEPEEPDVDEEEYLRSIDNLEGTESVSKFEFTEDKNAILKIISELSEVMETKDVNRWLKYIEPASIEYYSNPVNLRKAQKKLPNRTIMLYNIEDYFKYVFIPSRQRSQVDEIRYISKTSIKAVQVKEDKSIVVYYYFTKLGNKWFVHLPML